MSLILRIILIIASMISTYMVIRRVRKSKMQIDDAVFWVISSIMLTVLAVFPVFIYLLSDIIGTQSPSNLLYLIIIAVMLIKIFSISIHMSILESKLKTLAQDVALTKKKEEENIDELKKRQEDIIN